MNQSTKDTFIKRAALKPIKNGRVYVGKPYAKWEDLKTVLGLKTGEYLDHFENNRWKDGYVGNAVHWEYYLDQKIWVRIFGANNLPKTVKTPAKKAATKVAKKAPAKKPAAYKPALKRTNQEMVALSKELHKEYRDILDSMGNVVYPSVEVGEDLYLALDLKGMENVATGKVSTKERAVIDKLSKAGTPIFFLEGEDENSNDIFVLLNPEFGYTFRKAEDPIEVNGHNGKDKGTHWEFGCAKISKDDLRVAKNFLASRPKGNIAGSNRRINSVKIGDGEFTLEILEKMNL